MAETTRPVGALSAQRLQLSRGALCSRALPAPVAVRPRMCHTNSNLNGNGARLLSRLVLAATCCEKRGATTRGSAGSS
jgi:hypothetical protein